MVNYRRFDSLPDRKLPAAIPGAGILARFYAGAYIGPGIPDFSPHAAAIATWPDALHAGIWLDPVAIQFLMDDIGRLERRGRLDRAGLQLDWFHRGSGLAAVRGAIGPGQDPGCNAQPARLCVRLGRLQPLCLPVFQFNRRCPSEY